MIVRFVCESTETSKSLRIFRGLESSVESNIGQQLQFISLKTSGANSDSLDSVGGASAVFGKSSLKHSKSFRFVLSNQKAARALTNTRNSESNPTR